MWVLQPLNFQAKYHAESRFAGRIVTSGVEMFPVTLRACTERPKLN